MNLSRDDLLDGIRHALDEVDIVGLGAKTSGKVRAMYRLSGGRRVLITTDRISAFDHILGLIPYKGQVLNELSAWWFAQTSDIVGNHHIATPDPNVMIVHEAQPLPVEVIVRGYITGVTSTSLWTLYNAGERHPYGVALPDGLRKNDPLPTPILTPTTKAAHGAHDEPLTPKAILERGLVSPALWAQVEAAALGLFRRGQSVAAEAGLILVDTKYEFGLIDGQLALIDEVHTPDSSRYWIASTYGGASDPEHYDKEYLRKWYVAHGYRGEGEPPPMSPALIVEVASRYIGAYEKLTGQPFAPAAYPAEGRIAAALRAYQDV
ncbi:MAG TPA: phosphoribosylaminoimidazolesuccinocarboxamide synthase [Aggregatilineales bacterium]|nr:phosphoribosylaminoimidazolesuccinocarboxamide synthase [Anaerolineales bacterium]HRE48992.1 phosphoribosylaminoimidazolesuccinocarboxamide synthase [Aggregatilineales bacterium]